MKAEEKLRESMRNMRLSDDAKNRILDGALRRAEADSDVREERKPFYCLPVFKRAAFGLCAVLVVLTAVFAITTINSQDKKSDSSFAADTRIPNSKKDDAEYKAPTVEASLPAENEVTDSIAAPGTNFYSVETDSKAGLQGLTGDMEKRKFLLDSGILYLTDPDEFEEGLSEVYEAVINALKDRGETGPFHLTDVKVSDETCVLTVRAQIGPAATDAMLEPNTANVNTKYKTLVISVRQNSDTGKYEAVTIEEQ